MSVIDENHGPERPFATYSKQAPGGPTIVVTQWVDTAEFRRLDIILPGAWLEGAGTRDAGKRVVLDRRDIGELLCALLAANEDEVRELSEPYWLAKEAAMEAEYERSRELLALERERAEPTEQQLLDWAIHNDHTDGNEESLEDEPPFELASFGGQGGAI
jgi:hypothetical protein